MDWWFLIAAIITGALVYAYREHRQESRNLARLLAPLAEKYGGQVKLASLLVLPQLRFERDGRLFLVTAMATSGSHHGPFTVVTLELPVDTGQRLRVRRKDTPWECATPLLNPATLRKRRMTGDKEFDLAFTIKGGDEAFVSNLLAQPVRQQLLNSRLPYLEARVDGPRISVHTRGFARTQDDLEDLVKIASLLADRCSAGP